MITDLIREREWRQEEAIREVSSKWGEEQTISGPVLTIPYNSVSKVYEGDNDYKLVTTREFAHFLPEVLNVDGEIYPEKRNRGIFEVIVYNSKISLKGSFKSPDFSELNIPASDILWDEAFLSIGMTDLRSLKENVTIKWNEESYSFNPGVESRDVLSKGISTRIKLAADTGSGSFSFISNLDFNGSSALKFIPLGRTTHVDLRSTWESPRFDGAFLPEEREIGKEGFIASWNVLHLNRPYPQQFRGATQGINDSAFGVDLIVPVDEYQKSMRSAKYAVLFITLTFMMFFFAQVMNGIRIHPIQYILVGLALCVFYTLLIALSEHIAFSISYLIAAIAIIGLITLYVRSIFKNRKVSGIMGLILTVLYLFIYSIIQMEDYALLMGSIGLFIVLAIAMILSRKIDWYGLGNKRD